METKDNFFQRLGTDDPPFEGFNNKTLGMIVVSRINTGHAHCKLLKTKLCLPE